MYKAVLCTCLCQEKCIGNDLVIVFCLCCGWHTLTVQHFGTAALQLRSSVLQNCLRCWLQIWVVDRNMLCHTHTCCTLLAVWGHRGISWSAMHPPCSTCPKDLYKFHTHLDRCPHKTIDKQRHGGDAAGSHGMQPMMHHTTQMPPRDDRDM